jgi:hypothetical protein
MTSQPALRVFGELLSFMRALPLVAPGGRPGKFFLIIAIFLLIALVGQAPAARAQQADQVKAAFLFNFAKFVEWPSGTFANDRAAIILGVPDRDPLAAALETLQGKMVQGRRLEIRRCREPEDFSRCQIFFASASEKARLPQILGSLRKSPVLTVTDNVNNFAKLGGIINLIIVDDKIHFEICEDNARQSGLKISSQLLKLAKLVNN